MKTFAVAEWDEDKTGDKILNQLKTIKKTGLSKNAKKKHPDKRKQMKVFAKEKSAIINAVEGSSNNGRNNLNNKKKWKKKRVKRGKESDNSVVSEDVVMQNSHNKTKNNSNKRKRVDEPPKTKNKKLKLREKLNLMLQDQSKMEKVKKPKLMSLREKMLDKLKAAKFRFLNEQIYTTSGKDMYDYFKTNSEDFQAYHEGYKQQVAKWPLNPLDAIVKKIRKLPPTYVIADFGCGEAELSKSVKQKVHSFDLVATNDCVTACDMAHVPLADSSVDVAVFCLSLMGTNLHDYLVEANRVLKTGGLLKIAEVESRFESVEDFVKAVEKLGFLKVWTDLSHNLFCFMDFKKTTNVRNKKDVPGLRLKPCLYKKR